MVKFQMNTIKYMSKAVRSPKYCIDENDILITFDGFRAVRIPQTMFYLDISKMAEMSSLKSILGMCQDLVECYKTSHIVQDNKATLRMFRDVNNEKHYISEKFVKDMIYKDYEYYATKTGILCCKNDIPIEFICYVKCKEE